MSQLGFFLTFEGSEGCGKSTQIALLAEKLRTEKVHREREVLVIREPGGTPVGEQIRHLLQYAPESAEMIPEAELLLFAASRAQLVREVIRPALGRGAVVLCDRFHDSTTVYQGVARNLRPGDVLAINDFATGGVIPNATILLDLEVSLGRARMLERNARASAASTSSPQPPDRMEKEPLEFYREVRRGYLELAQREPDRFLVIDASGPPEEVAEVIAGQLKERCHGLF